MAILYSSVNPSDPQFQANEEHQRGLAKQLRERLAQVQQGGGPKYRDRHEAQGKLFVRQGFSPLFDVPVKIADPEAPLGTHVFTATEVQNDGADIRWIVVSMPQELPRVTSRPARPRERGARQTVEAPPPKPTPDRANAALDRIEIPPDAVDRISELLTPSSSLIISDNPLSHETGQDTDFIVVMH